MRLDTYLQTHNYFSTREKAKAAIQKGLITVNNQLCTKPAKQIGENDIVDIEPSTTYVSRAAHKLLEALQHFNLTPKNKSCLDIGSSTGGFTQVLLEQEAAHVTAVDVGTDQLDPSLKNSENLDLHEQTDIRDFKPQKTYDLITTDLSFIPLNRVLSTLQNLSNPKTKLLLLYKPQFQVGKQNLKKGIVTVKDLSPFLNKFEEELNKNGIQLLDKIKLKTRGKKGNTEYFLYCQIKQQ